MATVFLPLSRFSRKIILAEYGTAEPVVPGRADWLSDQLRIDRRDTRFPDNALAALSATVLLEVPASLADRIAIDGQRTGAVLHRLHIEQLTRHMLSAVIMGGEAKLAMRAFYDMYRIDDDDLDEQSVYREYGRFSRKFFQKISAKSVTKSGNAVRPDCRIWQGVSLPVPRITNAALDAICDLLDERLRECRIRRLTRLTRQAHIFIYCVRGQRTPTKAAERFKVSRRSVYRALRAVRHRMRDNKRFAQVILPLTDLAFVLPAPAALPTASPEQRPPLHVTIDETGITITAR